MISVFAGGRRIQGDGRQLTDGTIRAALDRDLHLSDRSSAVLNIHDGHRTEAPELMS